MGIFPKTDFGLSPRHQVRGNSLETPNDSNSKLLRYDYYAETKMLIVQFPSTIHETGVAAISHEFSKACIQMEEQEAGLALHWTMFHAKDSWYGDERKEGVFIADATFDVDGESLLHVEVAFSQTWSDVRAKVRRILNSRLVLGVLVMDIKEAPRWSCPSTPSVTTDFIEKRDWTRRVMESQEAEPFGRIMVDGRVWMEHIEVDVYFFDKSWKDSDGDPPKVSSP